jgi:DNA-binding XRE family transcriptional regulator
VFAPSAGIKAPVTPRKARAYRVPRSHAGLRAAAAGVSVETLRKIETGRIPTPAFFTVAAVADVLGLSVDDLSATSGATGSQAS